jgi:hypothetical protein
MALQSNGYSQLISTTHSSSGRKNIKMQIFSHSRTTSAALGTRFLRR